MVFVELIETRLAGRLRHKRDEEEEVDALPVVPDRAS
jgi:hypothetical protein